MRRSAAICATLTATSSRLGKAPLPKAEDEKRHDRRKRLGDRLERLVRPHALRARSGVASVAAPSAVHVHASTGTTLQHGSLSQQRRSRWQTSFQRRWRARGEPWRCMNGTASRRVQAEQPLSERWSHTIACSRDALGSIRRIAKASVRSRSESSPR